MTRALQALLISLPLLISGLLVLLRHRRGDQIPGMYLLGLLGMVGMACIWWVYAGAPDGGPQAAWLVGLVAALIAVVVAASPRWAAPTVLVSAAVAPLAFLGYTGYLYTFGAGAIDEFGDQIPFLAMAGVSLIASTIYVIPALVIWTLLKQGSRPAVTAPPGWYPDPGDPTTHRLWDGAHWTGQARPAQKTPPSTA